MMKRWIAIGSAVLGVSAAAVVGGQVCEPELVYQGPIECAAAGSPVIAGDLLYLPVRATSWCMPEAGLWIYDISDPHALRDRGRLRLWGVSDVAVSGEVAVVTNVERSREGFLRTVDVSDPASPQLLGEIRFDELPWSVAVAGSTAYVTGSDFGLVIVDISDPQAPAVLSSLELPGRFDDVVVEDTLVYLVDGERGLLIIDVADPAAPMELALLAIPPATYRVAVHDGVAYVTTSNGLLAVDVSDPRSPWVVATVHDESLTVDVDIEPPLLWFSVTVGKDVELVAADISDPRAPAVIGQLELPEASDIFYRGLELVARGPVVYVIDHQLVTHDILFQLSTVDASSCTVCYADCDGSGALDFFDFLCFQNLFAAGDPRADCDGSGELDVFDFLCFQSEFAAGCR